MLDAVRKLGFLQIDPISTHRNAADPRALEPARCRTTPAELDRLLWEERKLFEWGAFIWPIEDFPLIRARMRRRRGKQMYERRGTEFLETNAALQAHVLQELERNGPLLSREIEADLMVSRDPHDWWGSRKVTLMLELLEGRGVVAIVGRRGKQRVWDLAERWYPEAETHLLARGAAGCSKRSAGVRSACASRTANGARIPTRRTGACPPARPSSPRSTA